MALGEFENAIESLATRRSKKPKPCFLSKFYLKINEIRSWPVRRHVAQCLSYVHGNANSSFLDKLLQIIGLDPRASYRRVA